MSFLDSTTTNIILTIAVVGLFTFFVTLLIKLTPSTETKEEAAIEVEIQRNKPPQTSHISEQRGKAARIDATKVDQKPPITVSPAAIKPTVQTETLQPDKNMASAQTQAVSFKNDCIHHFGYLRTFPKNTPIPDECFSCEKIVDCLVNKKDGNAR